VTDHAHYEELGALAASGNLSGEEHEGLRQHLLACPACRADAQAYRDLVSSGLPFVLGPASAAREPASGRPDTEARERFLARARREGARFSSAVDPKTSRRSRTFGYAAAAALALAASLVLAVVYGRDLSRRLASGRASQQALTFSPDENVRLNDELALRRRELASQQEQIRRLRGELHTVSRTATDLRRDNEQQGVRLGRSLSQTMQLAADLQDREQELAQATEEIARINQLRAADLAALEGQRVRVFEIANQLRIADATLDMERQLSAAGKDIRELMLAHQLRVVDVRDTDANGRSSAAFARLFLSENQSIRIFAFDLVEGREQSPDPFQVWGEELGNAKSLRNLGVLDVDDRRQNRWSLTVQNADLLKTINSVFVTAAAHGGAPEGPRLLYAFLGSAGPS
jgi:hypothetical protein